jgi:23S rRNA pseudouridine1911/1915/1917 synthase
MQFTIITAARLDHFLVTQLTLSRAKVQTLIHNGQVSINSKKQCKSGTLLRPNDCVSVDKETRPSIEILQKPPPKLPFIYEDTDIIVIDKPKGVVVHHGVNVSSGTVIDTLLQYDPAIKLVGDPHRPGIVHRLDKNTEGIMIIAKNSAAHTDLSAQFKAHHVTKKYHALVYGDLKQDHYRLTEPIGKHPHRGHLKWVGDRGKHAETHVTVIKRFNTKTLVDITPITGRTHQIRVHLAYLGHPVIGDPEYGPKKNAIGQLLVAYLLTFVHPRTKQQMTITRAGL